MRPLGREIASVALLAVSLTGCSNLHIPVPFRPPPPPPPLQTGQGSLEARVQQQHQPPPAFPPAIAQTAPPTLPLLKQTRAKRGKKTRHAESAAEEPQPAVNTAPPAAPQPPAAPAIGPLTTGDSATEARTKHDTETLIAETEEGLGAIKRALSKDEDTTAGLIRTYLLQAKQSLANGDSDGAHGLATKAKQLLDELTKQ